MHQDVYNQNFRGEGAPNWAVCTNNVPIVPERRPVVEQLLESRPCRRRSPLLDQRRRRRPPGPVRPGLGNRGASYFKNNRWVVGYDPYNEPFSTETQTAAGSTFTGNLECFYTGKSHTGFLANGASPLVCPADVPDNGVIPSIQAVDHHHLIFVEPDIYWVTGGNVPSQLGPMPFQRLVFNFHVYCGDRSPVTGQSDRPAAVPAVRGDRGVRTGHHPPVHELARTSRAGRPSS